jgi:hypothetical protein
LKAGKELKITPMTRKLLSLLVLLTTLSNIYAQQAEVIGSLFYNNYTNIITIRLAIYNKTASDADMEYVGQRWGIQYNESAVNYVGYFSYMYKGTDHSSGLNDNRYLSFIGPDTGPSPAINTDYILNSWGYRTAYDSLGNSKVMQMRYINRSTDTCVNSLIIPAEDTRIVLDVFFSLDDPNLVDYYGLNNANYGWDTPDFIAQFFTKNNGGHEGVLKSNKTEIGITVIRNDNTGNPYQPFDMTCSNGKVNPITVKGDDIYFLDPEEGILSSKLKSAFVKERTGYAELTWGGNFKTIGLVMSDDDAATKDYMFKDKLTGSETELRYRIKAFSNDGAVSYSNIMKLNLKQVEVTEIRIVPNPVSSFAQLNLPVINGSYLVRVYNVDGRMILTSQVQGRSQSMNVSQLSTGNYFIEAFHPQTGKRYYGKFSKQ